MSDGWAKVGTGTSWFLENNFISLLFSPPTTGIISQIISSSSFVKSSAISQFIKPGNTLSVLLFHVGNEKFSMNSSLDMAGPIAKKKMISAIPFCPIEENNIIMLMIRITGFSSPSGKPLPKGDARLETLSDLGDAKLTIALGKKDTMMAMQGKSSSENGPFQLMVAIGDHQLERPIL